MARSRNIKPQFFLNEHLSAKSPHARLLFTGLWCLADCKGRLEDRPLRIKAALFPYEDIDIDALLDELAAGKENFIVRYAIDGNRYIEIPNFSKHQNPHKREKDTGSQIPPCPVQGRVQAGTSTVLASDLHCTSPADSLLLIPDSPTPETPVLEIVSEGGLEEENKQAIAFAQKGADYLLSLNSPNHTNTVWVCGFLNLQFIDLFKNRPDLSPEQILDCWRDVCDSAMVANASAPRWFKTTFSRKLHALTPERENNAPTALPAGEVEALLTFPFVRHLMTGEIFNSEDLYIADDSPNGLTNKKGGYFPFRHLEGVTEVVADA